jgi:hypothetical protein
MAFVACSNQKHSSLQSETSYTYVSDSWDKFTKRDENRAALIEARTFTQQVLDANSNIKDLAWLEIAEIHLRTFDFEVSHYFAETSQKESRKSIYQNGLTSVDKYLNRSSLGFEHPAYFYFKILFLIKKSENSTFFEQLDNLKIITELFNRAFDIPETGTLLYEGGGLYRLKSILKKLEFYRGVAGGVYNPNEALNLINLALKSEPYPGSYDGILSCENYKIKIELERSLSRNQKKAALFSAQVAHDYTSYLLDELLPESIRAETIDCVNSVKKMVNQDGYAVKVTSQGRSDLDYSFAIQADFLSFDTSNATAKIETYCPSSDYYSAPSVIAKVSIPFEYIGSRNSGVLNSITITINSDEIGCDNVIALLDTQSLNTRYSTLDVVFNNLGKTDDAFVKEVNTDLEVKSVELLNFSATMSGQVLAQANMFCLIGRAELKAIDPGILRDLMNSYLNIFGTRYVDDKKGTRFTCPTDKNLKNEISLCEANSSLSTPFCNSYRLYIIPLNWVRKNHLETKKRLLRLENSNSAVKAELEALEQKLQAEIDLSKDVLGETDD